MAGTVRTEAAGGGKGSVSGEFSCPSYQSFKIYVDRLLVAASMVWPSHCSSGSVPPEMVSRPGNRKRRAIMLDLRDSGVSVPEIALKFNTTIEGTKQAIRRARQDRDRAAQ